MSEIKITNDDKPTYYVDDVQVVKIDLIDGEKYLFKHREIDRLGVFHQDHEYFGRCFTHGLNWWMVDDCDQIIPLNVAVRALELQAENERLRVALKYIMSLVWEKMSKAKTSRIFTPLQEPPWKTPMTNKIPTDFANLNSLHYAAIICLVVVFIGCPVASVLALRADQPEPLGALAGAEVSTRNTITPTLTPTPTTTKRAEPTPTHELLHTSTPEPILHNMEIAPIIEYETVVVYETVIVTGTPVPTYTPYPTPTRDLAAVQAEHDRRIQRGYDALLLVISWVGAAVGTILGVTFLLLALVSAIKETVARWKSENMPSLDDTTETAEEIADLATPTINDWRDKSRANYIRRLRVEIDPETGKPYTLRAIERLVWPGAKSEGGSHYKFIERVLRRCDPLGEYGPTSPPPHPPAPADGATQA